MSSQCLWDELLFFDVHVRIVHFLDPLSSLMMRMVSKGTQTLVRPGGPVNGSLAFYYLTYGSTAQLRRCGGKFDPLYAYYWAIATSNLAALEWLHKEKGIAPTARHVTEAAFYGRHKSIKWLLENGCSLDSYALDSAAEKNHVALFIWMFERGCPIGPNVFLWAVRGSSLDILDYLYEREIGSHGAFREAIWYAQLQVLDWLLEHKYTLKASHFSLAVENENVEVLDWLHDHQCPFGRPYSYVTLSPAVLDWLRERGYETE